MATTIVINPTNHNDLRVCSRLSIRPYRTQLEASNSITHDHRRDHHTASTLDHIGGKKSNKSRRSGAEVDVFYFFSPDDCCMIVALGLPCPAPDPRQRPGRTLDPRPGGGSARGPKTCDLKSRFIEDDESHVLTIYERSSIQIGSGEMK